MDTERKVLLWGAAIFVIAVVAMGVYASKHAPVRNGSFVATETSAIDASDHVKGAKDSKVSLIEYGDFQCPACYQYEPLVQAIEAKYASKIQFVFRNFPLSQHQDAMISAQAAEAAGMQGKYWEMHDLLYKNQNDWVQVDPQTALTKYFDSYVQSLGLNVQKFNTDVQSDAVKQKIQKDMASAQTARVDHTPTFFVNLKQIPNPQSEQEFESLLDAALGTTTKQ